tara:strand:+ start:107 stop:268 length:162 start_codon:yes stop_codon:yes gene_type:complete
MSKDYKEMYVELAELLVGDNPLERYTHSELMEYVKDCLAEANLYDNVKQKEVE